MKQYLQDRQQQQHCHDCYRELKIHDKKEDVYIPLQSNAHPKSKTGNGSNVKENKGYEWYTVALNYPINHTEELD